MTVPGPGDLERSTLALRVADFDDSTKLIILSVPDDGVVAGTSGTVRVVVAQLVIETLSASGVRTLIGGLDARGALRPTPRVLRTPTSLLMAESASGDTIATWGLDMAADLWLHQAFQLREPDSLGPMLLQLPGGREMITPEVAEAATPRGRATQDWIADGLADATGGRRGRVSDPDDPFSGYDYAAADEDD